MSVFAAKLLATKKLVAACLSSPSLRHTILAFHEIVTSRITHFSIILLHYKFCPFYPVGPSAFEVIQLYLNSHLSRKMSK